jgi:hypothetical protein
MMHSNNRALNTASLFYFFFCRVSFFFLFAFLSPPPPPPPRRPPPALALSGMALKSNIIIAAACVFSFTMGIYINSLHDMALEGPERLRGLGSSLMSRISAPSPIVLLPQQASSYNASHEHGPLVRVSDSLYFITGAPFLTRPLSFHGCSPHPCLVPCRRSRQQLRHSLQKRRIALQCAGVFRAQQLQGSWFSLRINFSLLSRLLRARPARCSPRRRPPDGQQVLLVSRAIPLLEHGSALFITQSAASTASELFALTSLFAAGLTPFHPRARRQTLRQFTCPLPPPPPTPPPRTHSLHYAFQPLTPIRIRLCVFAHAALSSRLLTACITQLPLSS